MNGDVTINLDAATVTEITDNTAKVGITTQQASDITDNNAKISYTDASDVAANTLKNSYPSGDATKVGHLTVTQAVDLDQMETDIATNLAKNSITTAIKKPVIRIAKTGVKYLE